MTAVAPEIRPRAMRSDALRLRTSILIRWAAITGQVVTILAAHLAFGVELPLGPGLLVIGASVILNLILVFMNPGTSALTERQVFLLLAFDLAQLVLLLWLTGGLTNPFVVLLVAPVTISAMALSARATLLLGTAAVLASTLLAITYVPLAMRDGQPFGVPPLFAFGFWLAVVTGIAFLGLYTHRVAKEMHAMQDALLATQMALARAQKLTDLGGVVAAAAHELGTPLATIKLVSAELMDELDDRPELVSDVQLIRDQADRCREILRGMGRAGKDDLQLRQAPLEAVLREAAEPHIARGKTVHFQLAALDDETGPPVILRQPEVIHGLRNLIQNAVDFARANVWIEADWMTTRLVIRISDDGPGYPAQILGRIGEPFMRNRRADQPPRNQYDRPEYDGMGLGLFIAKTLLERTGAELTFANAAETDDPSTQRGAIVEVVWPMERISAPRGALGDNPLNT